MDRVVLKQIVSQLIDSDYHSNKLLLALTLLFPGIDGRRFFFESRNRQGRKLSDNYFQAFDLVVECTVYYLLFLTTL